MCVGGRGDGAGGRGAKRQSKSEVNTGGEREVGGSVGVYHQSLPEQFIESITWRMLMKLQSKTE